MSVIIFDNKFIFFIARTLLNDHWNGFLHDLSHKRNKYQHHGVPEKAVTHQGGRVSSRSKTDDGTAQARARTRTQVYAEAKSSIAYAVSTAIANAKKGKDAHAEAKEAAIAIGKACALAGAETYVIQFLLFIKHILKLILKIGRSIC